MTDETQKTESTQVEANPIEEAKALLQAIKEENEKSRELLKKNQEVVARGILGGKSFAGTVEPVIDANAERIAKLNAIFKNTGLVLK